MISRLLSVLACCLALPALAIPVVTRGSDDPGSIVMRFTQGDSRDVFLQELKAAVANHSDGWYAKEFPSLIPALEHEPAPPGGYDKVAAQRTAEESINAWIYDLRDVSEGLHNARGSNPIADLNAAGPPAMDALIAALDDDTPTRQLGVEAGESLAILLRRNDLALECIEHISGITFFRRTQGRGGYFHNDAGHGSVTNNIHQWWRLAKGKSQADGLRIQLELWKQNTTIRQYSYTEADLLFTIAALESPDRVIDRLRELCRQDTIGLNSPITEGMLRLDPQFLLRLVFACLKDHRLRDGDYSLLLKYGDKETYRELNRRAEQDGKLDPGPWTTGQQAEQAAQYGKNWAIPMIATVLWQTKMTGSRSFGGPGQNFCPADEAIVPFQELTGQDFGYHRDDSETDRLAAIHRAQEWWTKEGRVTLAEKIAADHPCQTDGTDLLASDDQIAATVAAIGSPETATARTAVHSLQKVFSFRTQQALLTLLEVEADADQRVLILQKLDQPALWQAPTLARCFESDPAMQVRIAAGAATLTSLEFSANYAWNRRLETRDRTLDIVRRVAQSPPPELLMPALRILIRHGSSSDLSQIRKLAAQDPASSDPEVQRFLRQRNP